MSEVTKKSSKDELYDAVKKHQKRAQENEARRKAAEDSSAELQCRVDGLQMQVDLYKERDKENEQNIREYREKEQEYLLQQATVASLMQKQTDDAAAVKTLEDRLRVCEAENLTLKEVVASNETSASYESETAMASLAAGRDVDQVLAALKEKEKALRDASSLVEEQKMRINNLMKAHEAFLQQNRMELEAEIEQRVEPLKEELKQHKRQWEAERDAMVHAHLRQVEELQAQCDDLREGLETEPGWGLKDKEVHRLKQELEEVTSELNASCERITTLKSLHTDIDERDEAIARLKDQVLEAQSDLEDTRVLCIQALRVGAARGELQLNSNSSMVSGSGASSASGASGSPPPSPREGSDLFDLVAGRKKGRGGSAGGSTDDAQLSRYKNKIRAQEQARQRNMDEVEQYRADYVHALLTELEQLRRAVDRTEDSVGSSSEAVRLRGEFQREREEWEEEKMQLQARVDELTEAAAASTTVDADAFALFEEELKEKEGALQAVQAQLAAVEPELASLRAAAARVAVLEKDLADVSADLALAATQRAALQTSAEAAEVRASAALAECNAKLQTAEGTVSRLQAEVAAAAAATQTRQQPQPTAAPTPVVTTPAAVPVAAAAPVVPVATPTTPAAVPVATPVVAATGAGSAATTATPEQERKDRLEAMRAKFRSVKAANPT